MPTRCDLGKHVNSFFVSSFFPEKSKNDTTYELFTCGKKKPPEQDLKNLSMNAGVIKKEKRLYHEFEHKDRRPIQGFAI